jgi:hypothetical protein
VDTTSGWSADVTALAVNSDAASATQAADPLRSKDERSQRSGELPGMEFTAACAYDDRQPTDPSASCDRTTPSGRPLVIADRHSFADSRPSEVVRHV